MPPTRTIYVSKEDQELWDKAKELSGDSISAVVVEALRQYVTRKERLMDPDGFKRIVVQHHDSEGRLIPKAFSGKLLIGEMQPEKGWGSWSVAITKAERVVFWSESTDGLHDSFKVFDYIEEADDSDDIPSDVVAAAAALMGENIVQELDI